MKKLYSYTILICLIFVMFGCSNNQLETMSLEEAKKETLKFKTSSFTPPTRKIDGLKEVFELGKIPKVSDLYSCEVVRENKKKSMKTALEGMKTGTWSGLAFPLALSGSITTLYEYPELIDYLKTALYKLPSNRKQTLKARYYSVLATLYADIGDVFNSSSYNSLANVQWSNSGRWSTTKKAKFFQYYTKAALSVLEGNLIAEEYYLREALSAGVGNTYYGHNATDGINYPILNARLVKNLSLQGRLIEAETIARDVLINSDKRYKNGTEVLLVNLSKVFFKQGRIKNSEYIARVAVELHEKNCNKETSFNVSEAKNNLISILVSQNKLEEAILVYEKAKSHFENDNDTFNKLYSSNKDILLAKILLLREDFSLEKVENAATLDELEQNSLLAVLKDIRGGKTESYKLFKENLVPLLKKINSKDIVSFEQKSRVKLLQNQFIELLVSLNRNKLNNEDISNQIFQIVEYNDTSLVQSALNASSVRAATDSEELSTLVRDMQDTSEQIKTLVNKLAYLERLPIEDINYETIEKMKKQVSTLRIVQNTLKEEIDGKFPKYSQLVNPKPPTISDIKSILKPEETMIVIKSNKKGSFIWSIPFSGKTKFFYSKINKEKINYIVKELRKSLDPKVTTLGEIPVFDVKLAFYLYEELLKPVQEAWQDSKHLLFVTQGELGRLPMGVIPIGKVDYEQIENIKAQFDLQTRGLKSKKIAKEEILVGSKVLFNEYKEIPWIIKKYSVTQLPSTGSLLSLRKNIIKKAPKKFIGFGDPLFNWEQLNEEKKIIVSVNEEFNARGIKLQRRNTPQLEKEYSADISLLPRLPDTADEINAISKSLNIQSKENIFLQKKASENVIKTKKLSDYSIVAFATHGLVPGDLDGLSQPALALTNPDLIDDEKENGLLTMGEILGLKLNADWVVLSACNTASSDGKASESVSGLGQAFFYAGARSLLVTHWPVETRSAKLLTTEIFKKQLGTLSDKSDALRYSQLKLINNKTYKNSQGKSLYSYAHPVFWAPFSLVGDRL